MRKPIINTDHRLVELIIIAATLRSLASLASPKRSAAKRGDVSAM
jgi:hypothetical protein